MDNENIGLLLQLILDKAGVSGVKKGMEESAKSVEKVDKAVASLNKTTDAMGEDFEKFTKEFDKNFKLVSGNLTNVKTGAKATADELRKFSAIDLSKVSAVEKSAVSTALAMKQEKEEAEKLNKEIRDLAKFADISEDQVAALTDEQYATAKAAMEAQKQIDGFNKKLQITERRVADLRQTAESINRVSQGIFIAGSSIVGSIFLAANQEAQRIKEAGGVVDQTTQRWLTAQERIQRSYQRIGRTATTVFLPTLEKVAALAEKGSKFVERHPELVRAALNTGMVIATVGAVGMLVAKGVRFVADATLIAAQVKYALSTYMFKTSVDKFVAAQSLAKTGGAAAPAAAGGAGTLGLGGSLAMVAIGVIIAKALTVGLDKIFQRLGVSQRIAEAQETIATTSRRPYPGIIPQARETANANNPAAQAIKKVSDSAEDLTDIFKELENGIDDLSSTTERAKDEMEGAKIIAQLEKDNLEAQREYGEDQAKIIADSNEAIQKATNDLIQTRAKIRASLSSTLSKLAADFAKSNQEADIQYQEQRARIAQDGDEEVLRIQKDSQEQLRKLAEDFAEEKDELTRKRDALGLVKAQREYEKNEKEIKDQTADEIKERRKQTQQQLNELRQSYQKERAERLAKYQQDVIDARANAAQELAEAQTAFNQRMVEIQKQKAQELAELSKAYMEERRRRVLAAYEQIKDLSNAIDAERVMRQRYYSIILSEASNFMSQYASTLRLSGTSSSLTGVTTGAGATYKGTRHSGGSVDDGLYLLKRGEYVLSTGTTQAAQSLIGSQLSQQALLSALTIGKRNSMTLNDQRRFDSRISPQERREIAEETLSEVRRMFDLIGAK